MVKTTCLTPLLESRSAKPRVDFSQFLNHSFVAMHRKGTLASQALCLLIFLAGSLLTHAQPGDGPSYAGKPLAVWAHQAFLLEDIAAIADTNHEEVKAIRAIGTNAIPWLLDAMKHKPPPHGQNGQTNRQEGDTKESLKPIDPHYYPSLARAGFWAIGEAGAPAVPALVSLLEDQPYLAPSALAGIGAPALPALAYCITNSSPNMSTNGPRPKIVASALGGVFVAIHVGRISKSEAAFLLPAARVWAEQRMHGRAAYWADGVLEKLDGKR
jgi:hypothetical protein